MEVERQPQQPLIELTQFSLRHFESERTDFAGTLIPMNPNAFIEAINDRVTVSLEQDGTLEEGYAPFCKHLWVPNFTGAKAGIMKITAENRKYLRSGYEARQEGELPVLTRWFEDVMPPEAAYLDVILYSRSQLAKEANKSNSTDIISANWGVVAINAEVTRAETPLNPTTMLRNALGKAEGGSGVPIDANKYAESVKFFDQHATVRSFIP